jgi:hypothetical protein
MLPLIKENKSSLIILQPREKNLAPCFLNKNPRALGYPGDLN